MKLSVCGDAYVLTSSLSAKDILLLKKHNPSALKVIDGDKNEKFAVDYAEGKSSISTFGITFGGMTRDDNGYATVTRSLPSGMENADSVKEYLADEFGAIVAYLKQLEESIPAAVEAVKSARKELKDGITIA